MNKSILDRIRTLRNQNILDINCANGSRYRVLIRENDFSDTAYYFSTPIYEYDTKKLVNLKFHKEETGFYAKGSNSKITVNEDGIFLCNNDGIVRVTIENNKYFLNNNCLTSGERRIEIYPTLNGVAVRAKCGDSKKFSIKISTDRQFMEARENTKCFAFMSEEFKPFMTLSVIGALNSAGKLCSPAFISNQGEDDSNYIITISTNSILASSIFFEINMYEPKLFQDTTVESKNMGENNAFGGMAFIGNSEAFGEQWLYSRIDYDKIPEIHSMRIKNVRLHIPKYNGSSAAIAGYDISRRFCSFGSKWENKIDPSGYVTDSITVPEYHSMDITGHSVNKQIQNFNMTEGLILRSKVKNGGYSAVATGDNYFTPQILEINFK